MKHNHHWLACWWHYGCPVCKVRQCRYGYRLDPIGYQAEIYDIKFSSQWDYLEKRWMLQQLGERFE